jgi:glycosyltransferase involved in cell wall biosynthesis
LKHPPTILLISYHFHPSIEIGARRTTALAQFLAGRGIRTIVISEFGGKQIEPGTEILPGIVAIPVEQPSRPLIDTLVALKKKREAAKAGQSSSQGAPAAQPVALAKDVSQSLTSRLRDAFFRAVYFVDAYKKWSWRASQAAVEAGRKYGARIVISSGPPHTMLLAGTRTGRKLGIPHIADLRDPWTAHTAMALPDRRVELALLRRLERWVVNSAAAVTSTGATVARLLASQYPGTGSKIHVILNGFDGEIVKPAISTGRRLSILFAGELYAKRNPFPLLTALETLLSRPDVDAARIKLTFMGRCATWEDQSLSEWVRGKRCETVVTILPQMPQAAVVEAMKDSTVLLNLAQQQPLSVPAKTYEHLASGKEILLLCENDSDTAQVVAGMHGIHQVDQSDPGALQNALLDLYQRHVVLDRPLAPTEEQVRRYSRSTANEQFLAVMNSVAQLS